MLLLPTCNIIFHWASCWHHFVCCFIMPLQQYTDAAEYILMRTVRSLGVLHIIYYSIIILTTGSSWNLNVFSIDILIILLFTNNISIPIEPRSCKHHWLLLIICLSKKWVNHPVQRFLYLFIYFLSSIEWTLSI